MEGYAFTRGWTIFSGGGGGRAPNSNGGLLMVIGLPSEKLPRPIEPPRLKVTHAV